MESKQDNVILEFINRIFLEYSPQYHSIKKIAERDLGQELIDKIHQFLEERKSIKPIEELKKIVFEDASNVHEEDINDIVDAFIKMRDAGKLGEIDKQSIDDILILFNQWIVIGKDQNNQNLPQDVYFQPSQGQSESLEQQILGLEPEFRNETIYPDFKTTDVYKSSGDFYESLAQQGEFIFGNPDDKSVYESKATYKAQRSRL